MVRTPKKVVSDKEFKERAYSQIIQECLGLTTSLRIAAPARYNRQSRSCLSIILRSMLTSSNL